MMLNWINVAFFLLVIFWNHLIASEKSFQRLAEEFCCIDSIIFLSMFFKINPNLVLEAFIKQDCGLLTKLFFFFISIILFQDLNISPTTLYYFLPMWIHTHSSSSLTKFWIWIFKHNLCSDYFLNLVKSLSIYLCNVLSNEFELKFRF